MDSRARHFPSDLEDDGKKLVLTEPDYHILEKLNIHGPLYTSFLLQFDVRTKQKFTHERLRHLCIRKNTEYGGPYLIRPDDQFDLFYIPRNLQLYYDLSPYGVQALKDAGRYHQIAHSGPSKHQRMTAALTANIDLEAPSYIPQQIPSLSVPITYRTLEGKIDPPTNLIPDAMFTLDYGIKLRHFLVEADRGTERVITTNYAIQSFIRKALQYRVLIGTGLYHQAYNIPADEGIVVLFVTISEEKMWALHDTLMAITEGKGNNYIAFQFMSSFKTKGFRPPTPDPDYYTGPWLRAGKEPLYLNQP